MTLVCVCVSLLCVLKMTHVTQFVSTTPDSEAPYMQQLYFNDIDILSKYYDTYWQGMLCMYLILLIMCMCVGINNIMHV